MNTGMQNAGAKKNSYKWKWIHCYLSWATITWLLCHIWFKISQKTAKRTVSKGALNLFWVWLGLVGFGWIALGWVLFCCVGANMEPSGLQMAPKINPGNYKKTHHILDRLKSDFWLILGPHWFWAPKWPPRGENTIQFLEYFWLLGPLGSRMPPRPLQNASWDPQDPSKRPLGTDSKGFWAPTW